MDITGENPMGWSLPREINVTLRGSWRLKDSAEYEGREYDPNVRIIAGENTTTLTLVCRDGLTTEVLLENTAQPLSTESETVLSFNTEQSEVFVNGNSVAISAPPQNIGGETYIALHDLAAVLGASVAEKRSQNKMHLYSQGSKIIFTENSRIGTIDSNVFILSAEAKTVNGTFSVPLSVLEKICGAVKTAGSLVYTYSSAEWTKWDCPPSVKEGIEFTGGDGTDRISEGKNTLVLPRNDDFENGIFLFAVYKNQVLQKIQISDLSKETAQKSFAFTLNGSARGYTVKGITLENLNSARPGRMSPVQIFG